MNDLLDAEVRERAANRCEYCLLPQVVFKRRFHIEHIVARQHGGQTSSENLALACWHCNLKKGPNLAGIDPVTGQVVRLFHPREHRWLEHFVCKVLVEEIAIVVCSPVGRATVALLDMNEGFRSALRKKLADEGLYGGGEISR